MKRYYWNTMTDGKMNTGMYTYSASAATPDLARQVAKPSGDDVRVDAWALVEADEGGHKTIIEIAYRDPTRNATRWSYCGITADPALWRKLGLAEYENVPFGTKPSRDGYAPSDGDLVHARTMSGATDERALAWLIESRRLAAEKHAEVTAIAKSGDDAIHAARIQRQAALIRAKVAKVDVELGDL